MTATVKIIVTSRGEGMAEALAFTEELAQAAGLERKEQLRLVLLTEELFGTLASIAGDVQAEYWVEHEGKQFAIHLKSDVTMTREMRAQLLAVSSLGVHAAARGFMGRLRDMIGAALLPKEEGPSMLSLGLMSMGSPGGYAIGGSYDWSLKRFRAESGKEVWDELEKSIVASIADDVTISILNSVVEITVEKEF